MSREARFVFDTNILVSALLFEGGKPGRAFGLALSLGTILISVPCLEELSEVLQRKKFSRYLTPERRDDFLRALVAEGHLVAAHQFLVLFAPGDGPQPPVNPAE